MDKKGSRSVQPASKGLTSDSKKSQDVASGKPWPRGGRRREPAGSSLSSKNEPSRKPAPQRATKTFDKRPRSRGTYNPNLPVDRTESAWLEENEAELGSVFVPGSKKQSLNHLLNFVYVSHEGRTNSDRGNNKPVSRLMITRKHKYNKEHFLQANCQFIVNTLGDYKQYLNNPDALVDWNFIEQVNVQVQEYPSCPICLYPPIAAKMTRCGHIYCWSCLLHYLSLSDKTWRKCPICFDSINKEDLKSVATIPCNTFNVNDEITFKLMKRSKGSLITYPASVTLRNENSILNLSENEAGFVHSKLLLANKDETLSIIDRENEELKLQLITDKDCPESCFIEQALVLLQQRKDGVIAGIDVPRVQEAARDNILPSDDNNLPTNTSQEPSKYHYFYQASDGQHIYLHAINARMLEHTYGSLEQSPETITGKILEKEGGSMTEELRKKLRYLQHLPVTCQFEVAEIQLKSPAVSKETVQQFAEQVETRRKKRQRRAKEEKRREKRITEEQNKLLGKYPIPELHLESQSQFPCFESTRPRTESEGTQPSDSESLLQTPSSSLSVENEYAGPSFAKMLAKKRPEANPWPTLKQPDASTKLINVTGQKMNTSYRLREISDSDPDLEELEPVVAACSLGDAIEEALRKVEVEADVQAEGKKKKKKNRQKVLFTTTMAYLGNK